MTWREFKEAVEAQGVKDDDLLEGISIEQFGPPPGIIHVGSLPGRLRAVVIDGYCPFLSDKEARKP